jgi:hypothetical protein
MILFGGCLQFEYTLVLVRLWEQVMVSTIFVLTIVEEKKEISVFTDVMV